VSIIDDGYTDYFGNYRAASPETKHAILAAIGADSEQQRALEPVYVFRAGDPVPNIPGVPGGERFEPGYHRHGFGGEHTTLIAVPAHAYVPKALDERKQWGIAAQLYSLRSKSNWGIGDFGDLEGMMRVAADTGAACVALNPLHALDLANPRAASPYSPLSRLFLNALYIDVPAAYATLGVSFADSGASEARVQQLRDSDLVDYEGAADVKLRALRELYERVSDRGIEPFAAFVKSGGERLRRVAIFQALMAYFKARDPQTHGFTQWPAEFHDPGSSSVNAFAAQHAGEVRFYQFLQWLADAQFVHASRSSPAMPIGVYRDLAVGVAAGSADVWMDREAFCEGISVGAPPDALNEQGQNWGLPPLNPHVLRARAYEPFIELLRANMRNAGALRIDHVMGLMRLFCIPAGMPPSEGTYVRYPFEDMLGVLALESMRNHCMIAGEDLGTVPNGFRERMAQARVFSCRVLYFEDDPQRYPRDAVASTGTHDLPPLRKYLEQNGEVGGHADDETVLGVVVDTYRRLGGSPALLVLAQIEDLLLVREQVNVPGTIDEVPNWQHKVPVDMEDLERDVPFQAIAAALRETRGGS
jgi:4-alpha-glucanotransferase